MQLLLLIIMVEINLYASLDDEPFFIIKLVEGKINCVISNFAPLLRQRALFIVSRTKRVSSVPLKNN